MNFHKEHMHIHMGTSHCFTITLMPILYLKSMLHKWLFLHSGCENMQVRHVYIEGSTVIAKVSMLPNY